MINSQKAKDIRKQMRQMGMDPKVFKSEYKRIKTKWKNYEKNKTIQ